MEGNRQGLAGVALLPSRDTAMAAETLLRALTFESEVRGLTATGGGPSAKQLVEEARTSQPHVLIGTPGKVAELFKITNSTPCLNTRLPALDEGDDLLSEGKLADVAVIRSSLKAAPTQVYASSFRAPLIKSFCDAFDTVPRILKRARDNARTQDRTIGGELRLPNSSMMCSACCQTSFRCIQAAAGHLQF